MLRFALALAMALPPGTAVAFQAPATAAEGEPDVSPEERAGAGEAADDAQEGPVSAGESGRLVLGPGVAGTVNVVEAGTGSQVATLTLRPERRLVLDLPAGRYTLWGLDGVEVASVELAPGSEVSAELPADMHRAAPDALPPAATDVSPEPPEPLETDTEARERASKGPQKTGGWRRWGAPLLSALAPGLGQMVNREPGKGVGILLSTLGLVAGSVALARARDPFDGAGGREDDRASDGEEIVTLGAYAAFTGALGLLYAGQIMEARRTAIGQKLSPHTRHKINVDVTRMTTVGFRPGQPAYDLYNDWNFSIMGQPVRRLSVGVADIGFKALSARRRTTFQAGVRLAYRVFDRRRLWLDLALGSIFQGTSAAGRPVQLDPDEAPPAEVSRFGAVLYGQMAFRIFVLDRWSLNLIPRFSVPMTTRYYSFNRSLPRYAPTLELGTGVGVYF